MRLLSVGRSDIASEIALRSFSTESCAHRTLCVDGATSHLCHFRTSALDRLSMSVAMVNVRVMRVAVSHALVRVNVAVWLGRGLLALTRQGFGALVREAMRKKWFGDKALALPSWPRRSIYALRRTRMVVAT